MLYVFVELVACLLTMTQQVPINAWMSWVRAWGFMCTVLSGLLWISLQQPRPGAILPWIFGKFSKACIRNHFL